MDVQLLSDLNSTGTAGNHEDRIFSILFQEDELTWQTIIYDLVKTERMDPWDINIGLIADRFIEMLKKMKEMDFRVGGKMILAAAILVKMKSDKLMKEDIVALDHLIHSGEEADLLDEIDELNQERLTGERPALVPRTPQPRQRKVSVYDLVEALEQALHTESKKQVRSIQDKAPRVNVPNKPTDMSSRINGLYTNLKKLFSPTKLISFEELLPENPDKQDTVYTFIPLLHLDTQRRIDLLQKEHFGQINIKLNKATLQTEEQAQPF